MDNLLPTKDFYNFPIFPIQELPPVIGLPSARLGLIRSAFNEPEEEQLLDKILQAIQIQPSEQTLTVELPNSQHFSLALLQAHYPIGHWLVFGRNGISLGWQFDMPLYKLCKFQNQQFIFAEPLAMIKADINKKRSLWEALKTFSF